MSMSNEVLKAIGGKRRYTGTSSYLNFGYNIKGDRSKAEDDAVEAFYNSDAVTDFDPTEDIQPILGDEVKLWRYERAANGGVLLPRSWQLTGSCVNSGGYQVVAGTIGVEKLMCARPESVFIPFTLLAYGQSRYDIGDRSEGEGSSGAQMAIELNKVGVGDASLAIYPPPTILDVDGSPYKDRVIVYTENIELKFSAARNHTPEQRADAGKSKLKFVNIESVDQAIAELRKGRALTWAGDWGGIEDEVPVKGTPAVRFCDRRYTTWGHQQSCSGYWRHPQLGDIFNIQNNWFYRNNRGLALPMHGIPVDDSPCGSYWIPVKEMEYQIRTGEVCSVYSIEGRQRAIDWYVAV